MSGSLDGTGCGDHDVPYTWGQPLLLISQHVKAHLLVHRGMVQDARDGVVNRFTGDLAADPRRPTVPTDECGM